MYPLKMEVKKLVSILLHLSLEFSYCRTFMTGGNSICLLVYKLFITLLYESFVYRYLLELYVFLVAVHLYANYSAVKALRLNTLNEDRLALLVKYYLIHETVLDAAEINKKESVFLLGKPSKNNSHFYSNNI